MPGEPDGPAAAGGPEPPDRRYWCEPGPRPGQVTFDVDETRHLRRVMRLGAGRRVEAIDGSGRVLTVELAPGRGRQALGRVLAVREPPVRGPELWLAQALIRPSRFEWLVEKAVELGIDGILPIQTARSLPVARYGGERWRRRCERIARAAATQSLAVRVPRIAAPRLLRDIELDRFTSIRFAHGPDEAVRVPPPARTGRILVVVGPEGGFEPPEVEWLEGERGAQRMVFGPGRLRAETAAVVALALTRWAGGTPAGDAPAAPAASR